MKCPHCEQDVFRVGADRLKARTSMLVIHKSGGIEINCHACKRGVLLPLEVSDGRFELKKAKAEKLVILDKGGRPTS